MPSVTIAGKEFELRYTLSDRKDIEKRTGKALWDSVFSGELDDQLAVMWGGMHHGKNKNLTPDALLDYLERDSSTNGGGYQKHYLTAMRCCLTSKILGNVNEEEIDRILRKLEEGNEAEGKEEAKG